MQESIDLKAQITYMGSKIDGPSGPRPRFFMLDFVIFSVVLAIIYTASMQNWHFWRSEKSSTLCHISAFCGP